jgi:predicted nuclease of predicted toxin-antitoxin system
MKFLVDAQLPRKLAIFLQDAGFDVRHTLSLPKANKTSDQFINEISLLEQRIVITKDADFVDSFFVQDMPWKLLLVSTGNIRNTELLNLFVNNLDDLTNGFHDHRFIEISQTQLIFHV